MLRSSRTEKLSAIEQGDVIFAIAAGGQQKLMLVYKASRDKILARHVTSQTKVEFGRDGQSRKVEGGGGCTIVSVRPLTPEQYAIVRGLDRKMRLAQFPNGFRLSEDEQRLLIEIDQYFKADPLPADDAPDA